MKNQFIIVWSNLHSNHSKASQPAVQGQRNFLCFFVLFLNKALASFSIISQKSTSWKILLQKFVLEVCEVCWVSLLAKADYAEAATIYIYLTISFMFIFINSSMWKCHHNSNRWRVQWLETLFIRLEIINGFFTSKFIHGHLYQISYKLWTRCCHLQLCDLVTSEHKYI